MLHLKTAKDDATNSAKCLKIAVSAPATKKRGSISAFSVKNFPVTGPILMQACTKAG